VVLALSDTNLRATVIEIGLTAEIKSINDPCGVLSGLSIGDIMTGSYTYDSDTPDTNPLGTVGDYEHFSTPYGINLSAGGFVFQTNPDNIDFLLEVCNNRGGTARLFWPEECFLSF
jgi:hypothetical protein